MLILSRTLLPTCLSSCVGASVSGSPGFSVGASVSGSPGFSVGASVSDSPGFSVGVSVSGSPGFSVGASVSDSPGFSVGASVSDSPGFSVGVSVSDSPGLSSFASLSNNTTVPNTAGDDQPMPVVSAQLNVPVLFPFSASLIWSSRPIFVPDLTCSWVHFIAASTTYPSSVRVTLLTIFSSTQLDPLNECSFR